MPSQEGRNIEMRVELFCLARLCSLLASARARGARSAHRIGKLNHRTTCHRQPLSAASLQHRWRIDLAGVPQADDVRVLAQVDWGMAGRSGTHRRDKGTEPGGNHRDL